MREIGVGAGSGGMYFSCVRRDRAVQPHVVMYLNLR